MVLGGREGSAVAFYARHPSLWTSVADRVWLVAVQPRPMCSGSSPRPCGMPVWWAPRHGDVAEPMQIVPYAVGTGPLGSKFHRFERMRGVCRDQQPAARPLGFVVIWRDLRGPARGKCPAPTPPHTLNYRAHSSEIDNTTQDCCLATSPCRSAHQTGMPMAAESCQNTSAAAAQLQATLCQPRSSKVKDVERQEQRRTLRDRPAPSAPLLCRASSLAAL